MTKKWQTVIVEDDDNQRKNLKNDLNIFYEEEFEIVGEAKSAKEALVLFSQLENIDVAFLDIELESPQAGLNLAVKLQERNNPPRIIFTTGYPQYAVQAIKVHPVDYLLKPFSSHDLDMAVKFLRKSPFQNQHNEKEIETIEKPIKVLHKVISIHGKKEKHVQFVNHSDIVYVRKNQQTRHVKMKLSNGEELDEINGALLEWKNKLNSDCFCQIHRSYFVNLQQAHSICPHPAQRDTYQLSFKCFPEERLTIGETFLDELKKKLQGNN